MLKLGRQDPIRFNVLVAGESGLGKSTFLETILQKYVAVPRLFLQKHHPPHKTIQIEETGQFDIEGDGGLIQFHLYDSPGYGRLQSSFLILTI